MSVVTPLVREGLAGFQLEAVAQINSLETQAYEAEEEPSEIRWEQAKWVAEALDNGFSTRSLAALWQNQETGKTYSHEHVRLTARTWTVNLGCHPHPRFNTAYHSDEVRKAKRENPPAPPLTGSYGLIYADPPWRYDFSETDSRQVENQYPTLSLEEICALAIPSEPDCVLYMWATAPKLREALSVIVAWGFEYVTNAVWVKDKIGMGYWFRGRHELLMVAKRGAVSPPEESLRPDSVIEAPRGEHSAKPQAVYEVLERLYPDSSKIELFARERRVGWKSWGNEVAA